MSLTTWLEAGWLQRHKTSAEEIRDLWLIIGRACVAEKETSETCAGIDSNFSASQQR